MNTETFTARAPIMSSILWIMSGLHFLSYGTQKVLRSFADAFLYVLTRWIDQTPLKIESYPALKSFRAKMEGDEGVQKALKRQDMEPLG